MINWTNGDLSIIGSGSMPTTGSSNIEVRDVTVGAFLNDVSDPIPNMTAGTFNLVSINSTITSVTNNGGMSAFLSIANLSANDGTSSITNIRNNGIINGSIINFQIAGTASINLIENNGLIYTAIGIPSLINSQGASISEIKNFGNIYSSSGSAANIDNSFNGDPSIIGSLINAQGGRSTNDAGPLTYHGALPSIYQVVVNGSDYGKIIFSEATAPNSSTPTMNFGIYNSSSVQLGTYGSVMSGVAERLLNPITMSGTYGSYSWNIIQTALESGVWNLVVFSGSTDINAGGTYLASNVGTTVNPVFAGGRLVMNQANASYSQNFTVDNTTTNTIDLYGNTSTFTGVFSNAADQSGNLIIANSLTGGKVIFAADNAYTGLTTINSGATLQLGNGGTAGSVAGDITNNGSLIVDRSNNFTYAGVMSGTGSLTKVGIGALTLTGANNYSGGTTVSAGSLIGDAASLQGNILNNAAVSFNQATDGTYAGVMSGTGSLTKVGNGALTLTGANTYAGGTTVSAGSLIGDATSLQGNILNNAAVSFNQATDGTYAGVMSGTGSLTKVGNGALNITGINTYSGPTSINQGALAVNGSLTSRLSVQAGAALQGVGSFGGGVINGVLAPGNSIGTITSNGNLTFASGSVYTVEVNASGASDKTFVNGKAKIQGGTVSVSSSTPSSPSALVGTKYTILTATNGVFGRFSNLTGLPSFSFLSAGISYGANDVSLGYQLTPFSTVAKNLNQRSVGNALTWAALRPVNPLGAPILNALFLGNYQNAQAVMDTVSGSGLAGVQSTAMQVGEMATSTISDQIAFWRSGETQDATGVTSQEGNTSRGYMSYAPAEKSVGSQSPIQLKEGGKLIAAVSPRTFRAWGSMFGGGANYLSDIGRGSAASNLGYYGGLIGVDYQIQPNLLVGVAVGGSTANFSVGSLSTNGNLTGFHAGVYGAYNVGSSYIALNETFSTYNNQTSRKAGGYALMPYEQLNAGFGSTEFRTRLEVGHSLLMAGLKATPFVAAEYAAYQSSAFNEWNSLTSVSTFALGNNGQAISSLPTFVGLRLSNGYMLANGWRLAPTGSVAYVHEFFPQRQFTNILLSMPGTDFNVSGPRSTYNLVQTKIGAQLNLTNQLALFTDFQGEFSSMSQSYGGKAGMRYAW